MSEKSPETHNPFHNRYSENDLIKLATAVALRAAADQGAIVPTKNLMHNARIKPPKQLLHPDHTNTYFSAN